MSNTVDLEKLNFDYEALEQCPLCEGDRFVPNGRFTWLDVDFWYVVCMDCSLKFMNPRPTREAYKHFYENQFWQQKIRNKGYHKAGQAWQRGKYQWDNEEDWDPEFGRENLSEKLSRLRIDMITKALSEHVTLQEGTDILEVGCAFPVTLRSLRDNQKCSVYAIEPSEEARADIEKDGNIQLIGRYAEELEEMIASDRKFDAIIFSHILENTVDPFSIVQFAAKNLKEGGVIYMQTPNLLVNDQMNPYHPYIFNRKTVRMMAEKAGLGYVQKSPTIERMLSVIMTS